MFPTVVFWVTLFLLLQTLHAYITCSLTSFAFYNLNYPFIIISKKYCPRSIPESPRQICFGPPLNIHDYSQSFIIPLLEYKVIKERIIS